MSETPLFPVILDDDVPEGFDPDELGDDTEKESK